MCLMRCARGFHGNNTSDTEIKVFVLSVLDQNEETASEGNTSSSALVHNPVHPFQEVWDTYAAYQNLMWTLG
jgi:hypothetical protein